MNNTTNRNTIGGIDLMRIILCFLIVSIHFPPLKDINNTFNFFITQYISRLGVPFFFITSSYFCFRKVDYNDVYSNKKLFHSIKRLVVLYLVWTLCYLPLSVYIILHSEVQHSVVYEVCKYLFVVITNGCMGSCFHLWYIVWLVYSIIFISFLMYKKVNSKKILIISSIIFIIGKITPIILPSEENITFMDKVLDVFVGSLFGCFSTSVLYVSIGLLFSLDKIKISKKKSLIGFIISFLFFFVELFLMRLLFVKDNSIPLSEYSEYYSVSKLFYLIPATIFLFSYVKQIDFGNDEVCKKLRNCSTLTYFGHIYVGIVVEKVLELIGMSNSLIKYFVICICCYVCSTICVKLSNQKKFSFLKYLY